LVLKAKKDPRKFEALYKKYAEKVYNYFWYRTGHNHEVAEDLMQETFLRAFRHLPKFRTREYEYLTYLLTIARNVLVSYFRKQSNQKNVISLEEAPEIPVEITQTIDRKLEAENLWRAVQELSQDERDAILLHYREDLPVKEIARIMSKSPNAVKIKLSRARQKLRQHPYLQRLAEFSDYQKKYTKPHFLTRQKMAPV